ncbi:MAG TPA: exodeoxyribonuclease VII small subunit [bacterium]|nr:exodeoxyribonuclease VII small subunit [bacterium]HOC89949.1 exodeoxyribonuclease VII small subunit [bacterium]HOZ21795.1 exodeoxyribonuclease VII small subunit [bacterium]
MPPKNFEAAMARLEEIAALLEEGSAPLEESLQLFEESNELLAFCIARLDEAEKKIQLLSKTAEGFEVEEADLD